MSILLQHARATATAAFSPGSAGKAILHLLSAGSALFLASLTTGDDDWPITVIALALTLFSVPLWRGLLWTSSSPSLLPMQPWVARAIEGMVFMLLSLILMLGLWSCLAFAWDGLAPWREFFPRPLIMIAISLPLAGLSAQLTAVRLPLAIWATIALPGLGGILIGLQLLTDGPNTLAIAALCAVGLALASGVLIATLTVARRLSRRVESIGSDFRLGLRDRLQRDFIRQLLRSIVIVNGLTILGWALVIYTRESMVAATLSSDQDVVSMVLGSLIIALPIGARFMAIDAHLGVRMSHSMATPVAWQLLPVDPEQLRRRLGVLWGLPVLSAMLIDLLYFALYATELGWLKGLLSTSLWFSVALLVFGLLVFARLPRGAGRTA